MRDISTALAQLAEAKRAQGTLPLPHAAKLRGLKGEVRSLRRAILETSMARAEARG